VSPLADLVTVFLASAGGVIAGALALKKASELAVASVAAIGSLIAAIAALSAARSARASVEAARFSFGVTTLRDLLREFNEAPLRRARRLAAAAVTRGEMTTEPSSEYAREAEDVLDFFETIGLLVRRDALDVETVWHTFYPWVEGWWHAAEPLITRTRATRPHVWGDFARLREQLDTLERKGRLTEPFDLNAFLRDECSLPP
jgi:hypothetical protein